MLKDGSWQHGMVPVTVGNQEHGGSNAHSLLYALSAEITASPRSIHGLASYASSNSRDGIRCWIADATLHMSQALLHGSDCAIW